MENYEKKWILNDYNKGIGLIIRQIRRLLGEKTFELMDNAMNPIAKFETSYSQHSLYEIELRLKGAPYTEISVDFEFLKYADKIFKDNTVNLDEVSLMANDIEEGLNKIGADVILQKIEQDTLRRKLEEEAREKGYKRERELARPKFLEITAYLREEGLTYSFEESHSLFIVRINIKPLNGSDCVIIYIDKDETYPQVVDYCGRKVQSRISQTWKSLRGLKTLINKLK